ncbi:MAG: zinc ribbon domain-containing protein [Lachnospiraceae bacterium]|nr:zinc ribbon domain-containing protein [Lachnospiraceae bacterium]
MGLFDGLKKRKYPGNGMTGTRMGRVYAGPGQMPGYTPGDEDDDENDDPNICDVYAGPGMMDEIGYEVDPEEPEEPEESDPEATETEATDPEATEIETTENEEPEPEEEKIDPRTMVAVYAGPDYWAMQSQNRPTMMFVYAGPAQMQGFRADMMPKPEDPENSGETSGAMMGSKLMFCKECGSKVEPGFRFCPFCATPLKNNEEQVNV